MGTDVHDIPFGRPMLGDAEERAVRSALASPQLVHGPRAGEFERSFAAYLGADAHATSVSSCTAGLHLAYMHLGVGPGDEVIVPAQTHVATAHAVEITGARPVFVDCDPSGNISTSKVSDAVSPRTKAICVVHFLGLPADMPTIMKIADRHNLAVVEDCALALGASLDGRSCGLWGDIASFSFYPAKHITTGEGGMVVSRRQDIVDSIAQIKAFGYDRSLEMRATPGVYGVSRLGLNYRMSELAAAIGGAQLGRLDGFLAQRRRNSVALRRHLGEIPTIELLPPGSDRHRHAHYCEVAVLSNARAGLRDEVARELRTRGIGTSVYYPIPLPLTQYYRSRYPVVRDYSNAAKISKDSIALPIGPHLDESDMSAIATELHDALKKVGV